MGTDQETLERVIEIAEIADLSLSRARATTEAIGPEGSKSSGFIRGVPE
jgi:hypothetical protein